MSQPHAHAAAPPDPAGDLRRRDAAVISRAYARYSDLVVERAEGAHLHTVDGRDVLDLGSGIGVVNLGHRHPRVVAAVHAQVDALWHTSVTALHPVMVEAAERLVAASPEGLDRVFWANSGAEAVEGAMKLARKATGRHGIVAFDGAFHGRTFGALSMTASKVRYRAGVGPLLPGVHHAPYGSVAAVEELLHTRLDPSDAAAIVVEPVLGEGGYVVPPDDFLPGLRRLCDAHGILLVADEVQTGVGRTGRMFACEHWGVTPDVMTVAKGLGNGLPVGAVVARHEVMDAWRPGDHGTTFGGNPVACAAVCAVLDTIAEERLCDLARRLGARAMLRMRGWSAAEPRIHDVRGLGLMIGVELRDAGGSPMPEAVAAIAEAALRRDVLVLTCGTSGSVLRVLPPLTIPEEELDSALDRLEAAVREVLA
ncbi:MAG TPA: aminotransferase class III-fold pyridoxal phosphate-dependent enzyme [Candidatus Dormibacteraeota bacterium]|nr:aminotransferase class III-fold pyridoxal phosphate-dependent enzyme [Candidatus Dormibacteraeota bacterium]